MIAGIVCPTLSISVVRVFRAIHCPPAQNFDSCKILNFSNSARITLIQCYLLAFFHFQLSVSGGNFKTPFYKLGKQALYAFYLGYVQLPKCVMRLLIVGEFRQSKDLIYFKSNGNIS
jgi:hypothetical protein